MKGVLINVAANSGGDCLGRSGPIFSDDTFRYVPIPEPYPYSGCPTYSSLGLTEFVPSKCRDTPVHHDPEFKTKTYGDYPEKPVKAALRYLEPGDWLFFLASLDLHTKSLQGKWKRGDKHFYIIGSFEIEEVVLDTGSLTSRQQMRFRENAHERRPTRDGHALFGGTAKSRPLSKAFPFTRSVADRVLRTSTEPKLEWELWVKNRKLTETERINSFTRTARTLNADQVQFLLASLVAF